MRPPSFAWIRDGTLLRYTFEEAGKWTRETTGLISSKRTQDSIPGTFESGLRSSVLPEWDEMVAGHMNIVGAAGVEFVALKVTPAGLPVRYIVAAYSQADTSRFPRLEACTLDGLLERIIERIGTGPARAAEVDF